MAVVTSPLFSLKASGNIDKVLVYAGNKFRNVVRGNRLIKEGAYHFRQARVFSQTLAQQIVRSAFKETISDWNNLTPSQQNFYKERAKTLPTTAQAIYIKENFASNYNPVQEKAEYLEDICTGFIEDMADENRINTRMLAYINMFE